MQHSNQHKRTTEQPKDRTVHIKERIPRVTLKNIRVPAPTPDHETEVNDRRHRVNLPVKRQETRLDNRINQVPPRVLRPMPANHHLRPINQHTNCG